MNDYEVSAMRRDGLGKGATRRLRRSGMVPGVIYGAGKESQSILVKSNELKKQLEHEAFFSHILNVKLDGESSQAVLKDMQRDPASFEVTHVDFMRVSATELLTMRVPLHFVNEEASPGSRAGGVISPLMTEVEITCLPKDLPEFIDVDLAGLELNDSVHLSQLVLPEGVELASAIDDSAHDHTVVSVQQAHDLTIEDEEVEDLVSIIAADTFQRRHRRTQLVHLVGFHVLQHLGGFTFAQGHQQQGSTLRTAHVLSYISHQSPPTS